MQFVAAYVLLIPVGVIIERVPLVHKRLQGVHK